MSRKLNTWIAALTAVLALSGLLAASASADRAFSTRFQTDAQGDITFAANTVVTCSGGGNGNNSCGNAQAVAGGASLINNDWHMVNVDVDADATTFNSSRATVTLPAGVTGSDVLFAGLYWGADTSAGAGGSAAVNAAVKDQIRFSRPGLVGYSTVTASQVDTSDTSATRYQAFADVTAAVQAGGSGQYGVANVQAGLGNDRYGGWTLVIAYEDLNEPLRNLVVRDGLSYIVGGGSGAVPLEGFITPTSGTVKAKLGLMSWEGELGYTPETVTLNGTTIGDAQNPANNVFNSSISLNGSRFSAKSPDYVNQLGFDADIINIDGLLTNGATSADLNMSSGLETLIPAVTTLAIDQAPRRPISTPGAGPVISGTAQEGSTLTTTTGTFTGTKPFTYAYQWQRCDSAGANCANIAGATSQSYALVPADVGSTIRVTVNASNASGGDSAQSSQTATVTARAPVNTAVPTITGTVQEGSTLTAANGTWTGTAPISFGRQWLRCDSSGANCSNISGATGQTYALVPADVGSTIRVRVTGTNVGGNSSAQSSQTTAVTGRAPVNTAVPTISGSAGEGSTLTAANGTWTGTSPINFTYQWLRCDSSGASCANIAGATNQTYALVPADVGSTIRVRVTGTNVAGNSSAQSAQTSSVTASPPVNTVAPAVSGTTQEGSTLTAANGTWTGTAPINFTYQWLRCDSSGANCANIAGATNQTYALAPADVAATIRVRVTGTNVAGNSSAQSSQTAAITARTPANTAVPTISGTTQEGSTLTAANGTWTGTSPINFTYQWLRCDSSGANCANISGATNQTYALVPADVGSTIRVRVTGTNAGGNSSAQSSQTTAVTARAPVNTAVPTISGNAQEGSTLTAANGTWTGTAPINFTYQWLRCDSSGASCANIASATNQTYALVPADVGSTIRVRVTGTNAGGNSSAQSTQSAAITGRAPANTAAPTVSGSAQEGSTLTAANGNWTGTAPINFTYQWLRCDSSGANCANIASATNQTYVLQPADVAATIRVRVTGTNVAGNSSAQSSQTAAITARTPANTAVPTISGTTQEGSTLTAANGTWTGTSPINFTYQWLRCDSSGANCSNIASATNQSYALVPADVGSTIRVRVTGTNAGGSSSAQSSQTAAITARAPVNTAVPTISGSTQEGSALTAANGTWTGTAPINFTYQWLRCDSSGANCSNIASATSQSYSLVPADVAGTIRVRVTGTNVAGNSSAQSGQTTAITARAPVNTAVPTISGSTQEGSALTAANGTWTGTAPINFTYQWLRCDNSGANCANIASATNQTYELAAADVGGTIRVRVTGTNVAGNSSAQSGQTASITVRSPVNSGPPTISGTTQEGSTLTATNGTWTGTAPIDFAYQWLRCDSSGSNCVDISGATSQDHGLVPADVGSTIRVRVTGTNAGGSSSAQSAQSAAITARAVVNTGPPVISGTAEQGSTLSATDGDWTGTAPISFTYQWLRCDTSGSGCQDIAGADGPSYTAIQADVDQTLRVRVTADNAASSPASATSSQTAAVAAQAPTPGGGGGGGGGNGAPSISGDARDGETLTADPGSWNGTAPFNFTYAWQRCDASGGSCADIDGETGSTYTLGHGDVGQTIRVVVTASNSAGQASAPSAAVGPVVATLPVNTAAPSISGTPKHGQTLSADPGAWDGTPQISFTYQWLRCDGNDCQPIDGATGETYEAGGDDVGHDIRVSVTATNAAGSTTEDASSVGPVTPAPPTPGGGGGGGGGNGLPSISGVTRDGETLTADPGTWGGTGPFTFAYQWKLCDETGDVCADIPGETDATYTLTSGDVGHRVRVFVVATNDAGEAEIASPSVGPVEARLPSNTAAPSISGTPKHGQTLSADPGAWDGTPQIAFTYQWLRCDGNDCQSIDGATGETYEAGGDDVGHDIRVSVTATNAAGDVSEVSPSVGPVTAGQPGNTTAPTIGGTPRDGETLTADPGEWSGTGPLSHTYQWQRCDASGCTDIEGAGSSTYTLTPADVGFDIRVTVTTTGPGGQDTKTSEAMGPVDPLAPQNTVAPVASGQPQDGQTLTADPGEWSGTGPFDTTYQWMRCDGTDCEPIGGATSATYELKGADVGHDILARVTVTNGGGNTSADSNRLGPVAAILPSASGTPVVTGDPRDGGTLTVDPGPWTGSAPIAFTYRWLRCDAAGTGCVPIDGATQKTYVPGPGDVGHTIRVDVTGANSGGSATKRSGAVGPVAALPPVNAELPTISGALERGSTLTADPGSWNGTAPFDFTYQWLFCDLAGENCEEVRDATEETYLLGGLSVGRTLRVVVTATNSVGSASATSEASDPGRPAPVDPGDDLSEIPGSNVTPDRCQQAPAPSAMSISVRGVGRLRFRVAATDGVVTAASPLLAAATKTKVKKGQLSRLVRSVTYKLDKRKIAVSTRAPYTVALPPKLLARRARHTLTIVTLARNGARSKLNVPFRTSPCTALFTANYRATPRRGGLRLRVDTKHSMKRLTFTVPSSLLPQVTSKSSSGKLRLRLGNGRRSVYRLTFGRRSSRSGTVLSKPGAPTVRIRGGKVTVSGLPLSVGIMKLELVRRGQSVRRLRGQTALRVAVETTAATESLRTKVGPKKR